MIVQKGYPSLCRIRTPGRFPHPAQDRSLRNIEAQHLQLTMNPWCAPGGIFGNHAIDEFAQFFDDAFSSCAIPMPREPRPIQFEPRMMPANNGLRLDEDQCPLPSGPEPPQYHLEQFVRSSKSRLRTLLFQNGELLPESHVFQQQIAARGAGLNDQDKQELHRTEHKTSLALRLTKGGSAVRR